MTCLRRHLQCQHFPVFGCQDHWQWHPGELRCLHFQPRQHLCTPQECQEFDTSRVTFTGKRVSVRNFVAGGARIIEDDWRQVGSSTGHQPWPGHTSFAVHVEIMLPAEWSSAAAWKSRTLRRRAGNTLLCESISLSTALGAMEKQVAFWKSTCNSHFNPRDMAHDIEIELGLRGSATVVAEESAEYKDPEVIAIADAKSLFDTVKNEQAQGEDDRSALEVAIIQESLAKLRGRIRWVPHNFNPADALTKVGNAHEKPMMNLLRSNTLTIEQEEEVLSRGKQSEKRQKVKCT